MSGSLLMGYEANIVKGAFITIQLALGGLGVALIIGILICFARLSKFAPLRWFAIIYTTLLRGIPDLVQLFLFYYGAELIFNWLIKELEWGRVSFNPFITGVVIIGIMFGAYMAETFRGAIQSIPKGQLEAAKAYGLPSNKIFWHITQPLMMRYALPSLGNNWLVLLKTTALVSLIGLNDLVGFSNLAAKSKHEPFLFYSAAAIGFLIMTTVSLIILRWLKIHYSAGFEPRSAN